MLGSIKTEQLLLVAAQDRIGDDHLRIEQRMPRQLPRKEPVVPVRPIDHRRHGKNRCVEIVTVARISGLCAAFCHARSALVILVLRAGATL
ncbi:hypothetical protein D9M70_513770 [compost metagenome]